MINVAFYVWPLGRLLRRFAEDGRLSPKPDTPPLAIVIAARDEAANLASHLPSVLAQAYPDLEVIVTDDASTDGSLDVLAKAADEHRVLSVVFETDKGHPGKKRALARSIAESRSPWLLTTDADCRPASGWWARRMMGARGDDTEIVLGYAPQDHLPGWLNRWIRYETAYTAAQYLSAAVVGKPYMGVGAICSTAGLSTTGWGDSRRTRT